MSSLLLLVIVVRELLQDSAKTIALHCSNANLILLFSDFSLLERSRCTFDILSVNIP